MQIHSVHLPSVSLLPYTVHPESSQHLNVPHLAILHLIPKGIKLIIFLKILQEYPIMTT